MERENNEGHHAGGCQIRECCALTSRLCVCARRVLAGSATITPKGSKKPIKIQAGDKVSISAGSSCEWDIPEPLMLHYNYGY